MRKRSTKIKFHVPEQGKHPDPSSNPEVAELPIKHIPTNRTNSTKNRKAGMSNTPETPQSWTGPVVHICVFEDTGTSLLVAVGRIQRHRNLDIIRFTAGRTFEVAERIYKLLGLPTAAPDFVTHPAFDSHPSAQGAIAAWQEYERDTATM